jgi:hypothetical protein
LQAERKLMQRAVGDAISLLLEKERDEHRRELQDEIKSLRIELTNLEATLAELRALTASERAQVIDIPSPLARSRTN